MTMTATFPTVAEFTAWAKSHKDMAAAVLASRIFAKTERTRVNAYTLPLIIAAGFANRDDVMFSEDDAKVASLFAEFDKAHRAHGFTGPEGYCPALIAEANVIKAEWAILEAGAELMGFDHARLYGKNRAKMLEILVGACALAIKEG